MTTTEIKKALYKQKPIAHRKRGDSRFLYYETELSDGTKIKFNVNKDEGEDFEKTMSAQLLIRWLVEDK